MSNGLFEVDGVDVPALVAEHLGPRVLPCVLWKPGAKDVRPANPTQAPAKAAAVPYTCRGFISDFSEGSIDGNIIKAGDRKVLLLGGTIEGGVEPEGGPDKDQVEVEGRRWNIHRVIARDPAAATYTLQVRA